MKKVDIRKIYVGEILKQTDVRNIVFGHDPYYVWDYEEESQYGLFTKSILGTYRHIVTGEEYLVPSRHTGGKHVINPNNLEKLTKTHRALVNHIVTSRGTFYINMEDVSNLEEHVNDCVDTLEDEDSMEL